MDATPTPVGSISARFTLADFTPHARRNALTSPLADTVPLLDVQRELAETEGEILQAMKQVFRSGRFILGAECELLEQEFAAKCEVPFAIGCASGSDALLLALMAAEIGPGDEVIVPSFTFFATASCVTRLGATPVFVDIDPKTFTLDVDAVASAITYRTRAIIPVHLFGQAADLRRLQSLAEANGLVVVEDCAQATGTLYDGKPVGSWGDVGCFSFYPTKNLGGCGDGGLLTVREESLARRLRQLRAHGMEPKYVHHRVGINSRLDTLQAAILRVKLPRLTSWNGSRRENAQRYAWLFAQYPSATAEVGLPQVAERVTHSWNQYTIRVRADRRDALRAYLTQFGIGTEIYYPIPLHLQECFANLRYQRGELPQSELAAAEVLSIPVFPGLTEQEQVTVVRRIVEFCELTS